MRSCWDLGAPEHALTREEGRRGGGGESGQDGDREEGDEQPGQRHRWSLFSGRFRSWASTTGPRSTCAGCPGREDVAWHTVLLWTSVWCGYGNLWSSVWHFEGDVDRMTAQYVRASLILPCRGLYGQ